MSRLSCRPRHSIATPRRGFAEGTSSTDLDDDCSPTKACRNMKDVTFDGFAEPGADLGQAWRDKLAREGKLSSAGASIRDLVLGSAPTR